MQLDWENDEEGIPGVAHMPERLWVEIVGLNSGSGERSCNRHDICGKSVEVGDYLRLKNTIVTINTVDEPAVKLVKMEQDHGGEGCTVGFIPRVMAKTQWLQAKIGHVVKVVELYADSQNTHKKRMNSQNMGMGCAEFVDDNFLDVPQEE
jgi:hypothetical protein